MTYLAKIPHTRAFSKKFMEGTVALFKPLRPAELRFGWAYNGVSSAPMLVLLCDFEGTVICHGADEISWCW